MKFNEEKVLYFATRDRGIHVGPDEAKMRSDLYTITTDLCRRKMLTQVGKDDAGEYYKTTKKGEIRLLELQIEWRENNGKKCDREHARLAELTGAGS